MPGPGPRGPRGPKPRVENPGKLMGRLLKYVGKNYGIHLVIVAVCIFVSVIANVQGTMFMKNLIDLYIMPLIGQSSPDFGPLLGAILKVAVFYLIGVLATFSYNRIMVYVTQGTLKNLRNDMFHHMESLPIKYFDTHAHGDIMSIYTNDIDTLRQMISQSMPQLLSSVITIVSVFVSMIILSIPLTLVSLVMIAIMLFTTKKVAGLSGRYFLAQQKSLGAVNGYIEEMMEGQKVVKVFCHEEESLEKFNQLNDELYDSANNANKYGNILGPVNAQLGNVSYVVCAIAGGIFATYGVGGLTLGALASFLTFNKSINMPINQVSQQLNSVVMALAGADRIFRILDEKPELDEGYVTLVNAEIENGEVREAQKHTGHWAWKHYHKADNTTTYQPLEGDVVFNGVDFGYDEKKMVLHDIKLFAKPGQKIAFVGSNELATTEFFDIIAGRQEDYEGEFKWGVTTKVAYFPKDINAEFTTDETIVEWLTPYSPDPDSTYVRGFLGRMLFAGEDGEKKVQVLSGGEKVRVLLSRMMIQGANVLVFDDPTNHLDMESITSLNNALIKFDGVIIFTSHDHQFIQTIANRIMEILPDGTLVDKLTTYEEYLASDDSIRKRQGVAKLSEED